MKKKISIHRKYAPLRTADSRYFIVTGGRGSGKSYGITTNLLRLTYEEGHVILFTRYTMTTVEISIMPEFLDKINSQGLQDDFEITKSEIINKISGSSILFRGIKTSAGNQTANLKSLHGVTTFVLDEAEELVDEDIFNKIDESVRIKGKRNRVILIMNPTTKEHWIYKRFFAGYQVNDGENTTVEDCTYIHTTYLDVKKHLAESFVGIAEKLKEKNPKAYHNRYLGGWLDKAEGAVFPEWQYGEFRHTNAMVFGQDYGFKKDASTLVHIAIDFDREKLYLKEIFYKHGMSTEDLYRLNKEHCSDNLIIGDSAEPRLISDLDNKGLYIEPCVKGPGSINYGIKLIQGFDIIVDKDSKNLAIELDNYSWKKNKEEPIDNYNHIIDAVRYGVTHLVEEHNTGGNALWLDF